MYSEPKITWTINDYFNVEDYNRIKNNLQWLKDYSLNLYRNFIIEDMGLDETYNGLPYADMINAIENNLETISSNTIPSAFTGQTMQYSENGAFIDYVELNRVESIIKRLHDLLDGQYYGRNKLSFKLNTKGVM
ncbi:MAG: hypothetical protein K0R92_1510 [Lachnospiraceae bacterium]|jgi:hypothetical protein|nr:hypothetical protein [Lachnospiraceae bacterium]